MATNSSGAQLLKVIAFGIIVAILYSLLFAYEHEILDSTKNGHWSFFIPISIAFIFSWAHGTFTGEFWDVLGLKAKK